VDPNGLNRRAFLCSAGAAAAAVATGGLITLARGSARTSSADRIALSDYERYDGLGLAALVKGRQLSAAELLAAAMERVEQRNPTLNAVVNRMYDEAKAAIAVELPSGPFSGVPYLLKDLSPLYAGTVTTFGSSCFRNFVPDHDSETVVRLKRAGLVIFGKTLTPEFGLSSSSESGSSAQPTIPGTSTTAQGARAAARPRPLRQAYSLWPTPLTAAARSASRLPAAGCLA
jgi:amidase